MTAAEAHYIVMKDSPDRPLCQARRTARASVALCSMRDRSGGRARSPRGCSSSAAVSAVTGGRRAINALAALVAGGSRAAPAAVGRDHPIAARVRSPCRRGLGAGSSRHMQRGCHL